MKLAASLELYAYWEALRGARGAPERNDIEPGAIRGILADTFILQFAPQEGFPFRVVGSRTNALAGRELRGATFTELWRKEDRREIARVLAGVVDGAQPFLIGARGAPEGAAKIDLEFAPASVAPSRRHTFACARVARALLECALVRSFADFAAGNNVFAGPFARRDRGYRPSFSACGRLSAPRPPVRLLFAPLTRRNYLPYEASNQCRVKDVSVTLRLAWPNPA